MKNILSSLVYVACLSLLFGCKDVKQESKIPPPVVGVCKVIKKNVPFIIEVPAKVTGSLEVQIRAQVSGILKSRTFIEGEYVKQGQSLFIIDQAPYVAAVNRAEGSVAQAQSEVKRANREFERMKKLLKDKAISHREFDEALSAQERADANLKMAQAVLNEAQINMEYTEVKAPISGIVRKEAQSVGSLISSVGESSLLTSMVQITPLHVNFSISGSLWNSITKRQMAGRINLMKPEDFKVEVIMADGAVFDKLGKVVFIDSSEDNYTSSVSIKAEIPNDERQKTLLPGQFVRVKIQCATYNDVVVIPASALVSTSMGDVVYVVNDKQVVEVRPIKSELVNNEVLVLEGLSGNEKVVSEGIVKARPGQPITPVFTNIPLDAKQK